MNPWRRFLYDMLAFLGVVAAMFIIILAVAYVLGQVGVG